jgi:hypothetical protein
MVPLGWKLSTIEEQLGACFGGEIIGIKVTTPKISSRFEFWSRWILYLGNEARYKNSDRNNIFCFVWDII